MRSAPSRSVSSPLPSDREASNPLLSAVEVSTSCITARAPTSTGRWSGRAAQRGVPDCSAGCPSPVSSCAARPAWPPAPNPDVGESADPAVYVTVPPTGGTDSRAALAGLLIVIGAQLVEAGAHQTNLSGNFIIIPSPSCVWWNIDLLEAWPSNSRSDQYSCWCGWYARPSEVKPVGGEQSAMAGRYRRHVELSRCRDTISKLPEGSEGDVKPGTQIPIDDSVSRPSPIGSAPTRRGRVARS